LIEQVLALCRMKRKVVSQRIAEQQREHSHRSRDAYGTQKHLYVYRIAQQLKVILQIPIVQDHLRGRNGPEAVEKKNCVGHQKKYRDPQQRRNRNAGFVRARIVLAPPQSISSKSSAPPKAWLRTRPLNRPLETSAFAKGSPADSVTRRMHSGRSE